MTVTRITNHVAEVAVPGQEQITVRFAQGELELGQEYDHEWHAIYLRPDNVLTLIRSLLMMVGLEDAYLYEQRPGGLCSDIDWPDGPFTQREVEATKDEATEPQRPSVKERRELIAAALRRDSNRSNRAIASECGVSDKTVGVVRAEIDVEVRSNAAEIRTEGEQLRLVAAE